MASKPYGVNTTIIIFVFVLYCIVYEYVFQSFLCRLSFASMWVCVKYSVLTLEINFKVSKNLKIIVFNFIYFIIFFNFVFSLKYYLK